MSINDKLLGTIINVRMGFITVLIDTNITNLVKEINEKIYLIGQIGTYVLVPVSKLVMIGIVTEFKKADYSENGIPTIRYVMDVSLIGTVKDGKFERGVSVIPPVDAPVYLAEDSDMNIVFSIFRKQDFSIGALSLFENERAFIDPNRFFSKHLAIVGSSGSGKSCAVASILQKVAAQPNTNVVIIDIHNEYRAAFPKVGKYLNIAELEIPYWMMNFDEMAEIFVDPQDEHAGSQLTVLKDLIVESKKGKNQELADIISVDTPVVFDLAEVRAKMQFLDTERISGLGAGIKDGPFYNKFTRFLVRMDSKLNDPRYAFMFKPKLHAQSSALINFLENIYNTQGNSQITIFDVSGVPFDVVNTIVSVLARMSFEFNFWNRSRRDFPILIVCEEAHNYLPASGEVRAARKTVERIAKEGRKYGVSCLIISQRPSEVSETFLAQCNNFVIMRLTNPVDQGYIRKLLPDTFGGLTEILPSLRQGEALVVGEALPIPLRVQIDFPEPEPSSGDILFFDKWRHTDISTNIQEVVHRWWRQER